MHQRADTQVHHRSFKKIGYKKGIDKGGIKYLEKNMRGYSDVWVGECPPSLFKFLMLRSRVFEHYNETVPFPVINRSILV